MRKYIYSCVLLFTLFACTKKAVVSPEINSRDISNVITQMTDVMIHDVTNPPLAARFFAYTCLAAHEVVALHDSKVPSMQGRLNEFPKIEKPSIAGEYSYPVAAVLAMYETAKKMQPSGKLLDALELKWIDSLQRNGFSKLVLDNSLRYAQAISAQILPYAKADRYNRISNYPRYTPLGTEGTWYPTPPGYFAPVEPYFNTIRPFTLDSAAQFKPVAPVAFSADQKSAFYTQMQEVYAQDLSREKLEIAAFWDCNPFALQDNGHLMVGMKKISPGAHWMGIAGIACAKSKASLAKTVQVYTTLAIGLMDGFYCCWDEKYRSNRIRPETAIRKYIDPKWKPFLQTPPFPEYLSGHSTISAVAAVILTHFFGEDFAYTDTVEERFGLKSRKFSSFQQAAEEAGISRLYGGIHFMDAITNGQKQGEKVGELVVGKLL
ncbi:vanadium-dependent haloperoxidase [Haliscomenobacter hydrossis]|uniref:Vanadium-dependent haloperoxidase family protein n=1 Tax=Haliscomenobacter hydrossis (strain ATCC 27775 / DSM 1100 / LMG 10767 / O) TaxID=760192 RepID=F4L1L3_HALH1|nr:vanadium-dependent haloperoxidase [Haliscomenobacter hydrossis]AEE48557.1 vanadium-dependent haloperoxidase family protein [Haliscomenobacter hydrossis DSM 1100]